MTTDTANQIISKYESLVVLCTYNILLTNDICYGQVIECLHAMKRTPYYKQAFKRYLNDADKARKEYERTVNSVSPIFKLSEARFITLATLESFKYSNVNPLNRASFFRSSLILSSNWMQA